MRKSRLSQHKQDHLLEHFVTSTTARCAASVVNVNFKTSASYFHRLREIIAYPLEFEGALGRALEDGAKANVGVGLQEKYRSLAF